MFYITSLDGSQVEPLINIGTDFNLEQSVDGTFTVSFSCFPSTNNAGYDLLKSEAIVTIDDYNFRVKQYSDTAYSKSVAAISTFYDHSKTRQDAIFSGSHTLNAHVAFALTGTGWTYSVDGTIANLTNYIDKFGEDNVVSLVGKICKYHQCEYIIMPNKHIHFAKQIGGDYDYQYRYKHNVSSVVLKEDTTNLETFIRGIGKDGLEVSYSSPNHSIFGHREAEPIKDDRFTDATALLNYIKVQIQDEPELAIESSIPELTARETGERIWLIYEPLGIELQTRILKQNKSLINGELVTSSVIFGNTLIKSSIDLLVDQKQQIDDTNDYIDDTKDELTENLEDAKQEYRSAITETDERITFEVEQLGKSIASIDIKANEIILSVNNLSDNTSSAIQVLQKNINLKVDSDGIISAINLSPESISISADKINLNGAVIVNGSISGATDINVDRDVYVGNNIYMAPYGGGDKSLIFDGYARIVGNWNMIDISAPLVRIGASTALDGVVDFTGVTSVPGLKALLGIK